MEYLKYSFHVSFTSFFFSGRWIKKKGLFLRLNTQLSCHFLQ